MKKNCAGALEGKPMAWTKQLPFAQVEALAIFSGLARPYVWGVLCQVGAGSLVIDSGQPSLQADIWECPEIFWVGCDPEMMERVCC